MWTCDSLANKPGSRQCVARETAKSIHETFTIFDHVRSRLLHLPQRLIGFTKLRNHGLNRTCIS